MLFQITGILILLTFYGCYFIKMISQRRRGIKTDQLGKGKVGLVRFIEVSMKIISFTVPIVEAASVFLNTHRFLTSVRIIGALIGASGAVIFILSVLTMRDNWRAGVPKSDKTELVTNGIYRISRNPAFLGFDLVYIGVAAMFFNLPLFIVSLFGIVMFHLQIVNVEEDFLLETFGDAYLDYKKKVNRYLGVKR